MAQVLLPNSLKRILKVCLVLTGIGAFAVIVMGIALINTENDNKKIVKFLEVAKNASSNFENSLVIYTEKTRDIINYLMKLRPETEGDIINFISDVEKIGQDLSLNIKLETHEESSKTTGKNKTVELVINYNVSFFGSVTELNSFLERLESLPYFVKVENIDFKDLNFIEKTENTEPNINLSIKLYIKNNATKGN